MKLELTQPLICLDLEDATPASVAFLTTLRQNGRWVDVSPHGAHVYLNIKGLASKKWVPGTNVLGCRVEVKQTVTLWCPGCAWDQRGGNPVRDDALTFLAWELLRPRNKITWSITAIPLPDGSRHDTRKHLLASASPGWAREVGECARWALCPGWDPTDWDSLIRWYERQPEASLLDHEKVFLLPQALNRVGSDLAGYRTALWGREGRLPFPSQLGGFLWETKAVRKLYGLQGSIAFLIARAYWEDHTDRRLRHGRWYSWNGAYWEKVPTDHRTANLFNYCDTLRSDLGRRVAAIDYVLEVAEVSLNILRSNYEKDEERTSADRKILNQEKEKLSLPRMAKNHLLFARDFTKAVSRLSKRSEILKQLTERAIEKSPRVRREAHDSKRVRVFQNGTLYLNRSTGETRFEKAFYKDDFAVFQAKRNYDPNVIRSDAWWAFLRSLGGGTAHGLAGLWKRGMLACFPYPDNQCALRFRHGASGVGKGLYVECIAELLGGREGAIWQSRGTNLADMFELHNYAGMNAVTLSEVDPNESSGKVWDQLASLSGRDVVSARTLFQPSYQFRYDGIVILSSNKDPRNLFKTESRGRRLHPIQPLPVYRPNLQLKSILREGLPGYFNWLIETYVSGLNQGLNLIERMSDGRLLRPLGEWSPLTSFLADRCVLEPKGKVSFAELQEEYGIYCNDMGVLPPTTQAFGRQVRATAEQEFGPGVLTKTKGPTGRREIRGIALRRADDKRPRLKPRRDESRARFEVSQGFLRSAPLRHFPADLLEKSSGSSVSSVTSENASFYLGLWVTKGTTDPGEILRDPPYPPESILAGGQGEPRKGVKKEGAREGKGKKQEDQAAPETQPGSDFLKGTEDTEDFSGSDDEIPVLDDLDEVKAQIREMVSVSTRNFPRVAKTPGRRKETDPPYLTVFEKEHEIERLLERPSRPLVSYPSSEIADRVLLACESSQLGKDCWSWDPWVGKLHSSYEDAAEIRNARRLFAELPTRSLPWGTILVCLHDRFATLFAKASIYSYRYLRPHWFESQRVFETPFARSWFLEERTDWGDAYARRTPVPARTYLYRPVVLRNLVPELLRVSKWGADLQLVTLDRKSCHLYIASRVAGEGGAISRRRQVTNDPKSPHFNSRWSYLRSSLDDSGKRLIGKPLLKAVLYKCLQGGDFKNIDDICSNLRLGTGLETKVLRVEQLQQIPVLAELSGLSGRLLKLQTFFTPETPGPVTNRSLRRGPQRVSRLLTGVESCRQRALIQRAVTNKFGVPVSLEHDGITFLVPARGTQQERIQSISADFAEWSAQWLGVPVPLEAKTFPPLSNLKERESLIDDRFVAWRACRQTPRRFTDVLKDLPDIRAKRKTARRKDRDRVNEFGRRSKGFGFVHTCDILSVGGCCIPILCL